MNQIVRPEAVHTRAPNREAAREAAEATVAKAAAATTPPPPPKVPRASPSTVLMMALVAAAGVTLVLWAWRIGPFNGAVEVTDNSYVRGQVTALAPQVSGIVREVLVRDYDHVKLGQPLLKIDDRIYQHQLEQAEGQHAAAAAALDNNTQALAQAETTVVIRKAAVTQAEAQLHQTQAALNRTTSLNDQGFSSTKDRDAATASQAVAVAAVDSAKANVTLAEQQVEATKVARASLEAQLKTAEAQLELAKVNLANTLITAPQDGQISEASVRAGQYVSAGSQLMFLVPPLRWIVANFKETQTAHMRVGQPARFSVDGLGGAELTGRVEEIAPATGSEFSVLKADNASGNFTKVVQRLPVRIAIDPYQEMAARLRPGMSVEMRVDTANIIGGGARAATR